MPLDPEQEADGILSGVWCKITPDGKLDIPVDPIRISEALGVRVFTADLGSSVSGMIEKKEGQDPQIILNFQDHPNRMRFSCAHELGHYLLHGSANDERYEWVDFRGPLASKGLDRDEIFCNRFAAALLMPTSVVTDAVGEGAQVPDLAFRLGVSLDAMRYRLVNAGLVTNI